MKRADQPFRQVRPTVCPARDDHRLSLGRLPVNDRRPAIATDLDDFAAPRPEMRGAVRRLLSVAVDLALMLPRRWMATQTWSRSVSGSQSI